MSNPRDLTTEVIFQGIIDRLEAAKPQPIILDIPPRQLGTLSMAHQILAGLQRRERVDWDIFGSFDFASLEARMWWRQWWHGPRPGILDRCPVHGLL